VPTYTSIPYRNIQPYRSAISYRGLVENELGSASSEAVPEGSAESSHDGLGDAISTDDPIVEP
jgi:hypothetical protein